MESLNIVPTNDETSPEGKEVKVFRKNDLVESKMLVEKAIEELKFCEDRQITPSQIILICVNELENMGFLNHISHESESHMYHI